MIEAVIIDLDDTLCMTEAVSFEMENKALEQLGSTLIPRDVHFRTWGKPLFEIIATRSPGVDVEAFKKTYRPIVEEFAKAGKFDDIPKENYEALDTLLRLDKVLIILTSRARAELHHLLSPDHLLASRVKTFYYRDNMQYHKPDPRAFDGLLQDSSLQPGQCIYVGDSTSDAQAAKAAGLHFVASLESGLRQREDFDGLQSMDLLGNSPTSWM